MFICKKCMNKREADSFYLMIAPRSRGNCEMCNTYSDCYDIHHSKIPDLPGGQNEPLVMQGVSSAEENGGQEKQKLTLINSNNLVVLLATGFQLCEKEEATHFCSVKKDGQEYNTYIK